MNVSGLAFFFPPLSALILTASLFLFSDPDPTDSYRDPFSQPLCVNARIWADVQSLYIHEAGHGRNWVDGPEAAWLEKMEEEVRLMKTHYPECWRPNAWKKKS